MNCTIDQSHRYGRHKAACREPAGSYDKTTRTAICFEHKTQHFLIRAPYTRIVVFWHISNILPMILQSQIISNTPTFYIATLFCETLLYNRQLVVIIHELMYGVRAVIRWGKSYCETGLSEPLRQDNNIVVIHTAIIITHSCQAYVP